MPAYELNRGINKPWEFNGFIGNNVYILVGGIGGVFLTAVTMFILGVPTLIAVLITVALSGGMWFTVSNINTKHGEHGLMKASARRSSPKLVTNRHSRLFLNLNQDLTGRT